MERINEPLLGGDSKSRNHPIINSIMIGLAMFFILYLNTESPYNISPVGSFLIFLIYLTSCFISPFIIIRTREKIAMLIAIVVFFITFIINYYIPSISLVSIIISPFALELLWISVGSFIFSVSEKSNIGLCFGLFFGFLQILGGLYSYFLNGRFTNVEDFQTGAGFIAIFIIFLFVGILLVLLLGYPSRIGVEKIHNNSVLEEIFISPIRVIFNRKFLFIIPAALLLGFSDILSSTYSVLDVYGGISVDNYFIGTTFIIGAASSIIIGFLFDKIRKLILLIILLIIGVVSTILSLYYWYGNHENQSPSNVSMIFNISMYGFTIVKCGILVLVYALVGSLFSKRSVCSSAAIRIVQLVGTILSFILVTWVDQSIATFYIFIALLFISYLSLIYLKSK